LDLTLEKSGLDGSLDRRVDWYASG